MAKECKYRRRRVILSHGVYYVSLSERWLDFIGCKVGDFVRGKASKGELVLEPFPGKGRVRKEEITALINKRETAVRRIVKRGRTPYVSLKESWVLRFGLEAGSFVYGGVRGGKIVLTLRRVAMFG